MMILNSQADAWSIRKQSEHRLVPQHTNQNSNNNNNREREKKKKKKEAAHTLHAVYSQSTTFLPPPPFSDKKMEAPITQQGRTG
jgi:hypothetical protein